MCSVCSPVFHLPPVQLVRFVLVCQWLHCAVSKRASLQGPPRTQFAPSKQSVLSPPCVVLSGVSCIAL